MVKYAIFHEGKDSKEAANNNLIRFLIKHLNLNVEKVQFYPMSSKTNFFKLDCLRYKELLQDIKIEEISKAFFVLDADSKRSDAKYGGYENTQRELSTILDNLGISEISDTYISCNPVTQTGYLESLILSTIPDEQRACIEQFLECSEFKSKDNAKVILNQIYKQAYPNAPYDFSHENFNELKEKLTALFSE
ncbi:MAG TPA: hypothetical protein EYG68_11865 [Leucothrix mucor]|nr:hypothetical protein [Leucothrix mucor]